ISSRSCCAAAIAFRPSNSATRRWRSSKRLAESTPGSSESRSEQRRSTSGGLPLPEDRLCPLGVQLASQLEAVEGDAGATHDHVGDAVRGQVQTQGLALAGGGEDEPVTAHDVSLQFLGDCLCHESFLWANAFLAWAP